MKKNILFWVVCIIAFILWKVVFSTDTAKSVLGVAVASGQELNPAQIKQIEEKAQNVLEARSSYPNSSLADLYNPLTMPTNLIKAHNELDKAVDSAYRTAPFTSEANRMVYLFELYEKYTADLFTKEKPKKKK